MRKNVLIVLCLLLSVTAVVAREIPREKAAEAAAEVFRTNGRAVAGTKSGANGVQAASLRLVKETPSMYVFENEDDGFVIASADDVALPVLGYSLNGRFPTDDMPVNMKSMLDWYERVIAYARQQGWGPSTGIVTGRDDPEVVLKTAPWGQSSPFNDLAPIIDGQKCPSGCVATAQAIIMKYYNYPERGTGVLPGYDFGWDSETEQYKYHIDGYALGHTYDWENMPENARNRTEYQNAQIAQLLYDIGVMSKMDYAPGGSGASSLSPLYLTEYFGYDKSMRYESREYYTDERWEQMIRDEIDAGRPVFHCGFRPGAGHAFVLDGYRGRYFSINYGWSGGSAWYLLTPVAGHQEELTIYNQGQDMVTHIFPDEGNEPYINVVVPGYFTPFRWNFAEKTIWGGWIWLWNYSVSSADVDIAFGLFNRDDLFKQILSETVRMDPAVDYVPRMDITLPNRIEDGDQILLAQWSAGSWIPLMQPRAFRIQFDRSRKLPQMISVGHSFGKRDNTDSDDTPVIYFDMYKDIWWEIEDEEGQRLIDSSMDQLYVSVSYKMLDQDTGLVRFELEMPEGTYRMTVRNFDETMSFTFTL